MTTQLKLPLMIITVSTEQNRRFCHERKDIQNNGKNRGLQSGSRHCYPGDRNCGRHFDDHQRSKTFKKKIRDPDLTDSIEQSYKTQDPADGRCAFYPVCAASYLFFVFFRRVWPHGRVRAHIPV